MFSSWFHNARQSGPAYFRVWLLGVLFGWMTMSDAQAQLQIRGWLDLPTPTDYQAPAKPFLDYAADSVNLRPTPHLRPRYVRDNPTGDSFLCQIEDQWEADWKIPVWFRAGEMPLIPQSSPGNLYVRMKLLRF